MRCPFCEAQDTRVVDSRLAGEGDQVRRRRECAACGERFTTFEVPQLSLPRVVKSNGEREEFSEEKLRTGFLRALEKRPVDTEQIESAISRVMHQLHAVDAREISSREVGEWVMNELRELDQVAFVRFASVYRSFEDVNAFREEIERLENEPSPELKRHQLSLLPSEQGKRGGGK